MIKYSTQNISDIDEISVSRALRGEYLTQGQEGLAFERELTNYTGSKYCVCFNSATSALLASYQTLSATVRNPIAWTTPISFVSTANAALMSGYSLDFVDVDPLSGNIDIRKLACKLEATARSKRPSVVCVVHLAGTPVAEMDLLKELAGDFCFRVLEDSSHALGSAINGINIGACNFSDASVFSFHALKNITTGEGGCVTTNDEQLYQNLKLLVSNGVTRDPSVHLDESVAPWEYRQICLSGNFRMPEINAALGRSQLARVNEFNFARNQAARFLRSNLTGSPIQWQPLPNGTYSAHHLNIGLIESPDERRSLYEFLVARDIGVNVHYMPIYKQPYYHSLNIDSANFPGAEEYYNRCLSFPCHPGLSVNNLAKVCECVTDFFSRSLSRSRSKSQSRLRSKT